MEIFRANARLIAFIAALVLGSTACSTDQLAEQVTELETQVSSVQSQNRTLENRVDVLESFIANLDLPADTSQEIVALGRAVVAVTNEVNDLAGQVSDNEFEIELMKTCVNEYMDTIGRWSSNVNSFYNYFYC